MKKSYKRLLSLILSVVMVLSMGISVLAAANKNGSVNVQIKLQGSVAFEDDITDAYIKSLIPEVGANADHLYDVPSDVTTPTAYTAADALIAEYIKNNGMFDSSQVAYDWDKVSVPNGLYFTVYQGMSAEEGTYYYTKNSDGTYTYYWEGDTWTLYIDGAKSDLYASNCVLSDVTSIVFDYNADRSETFTENYLIPGAVPAP